MKVYHNADVEERKYEGRSQMSLCIKKGLEKRGFTFVDNPGEADIINFHSSGIFNSFKAARMKEKYGVPVIYSLYSVSKTEPLNHFRNHFAQRNYLRKRKTSFVLSYSAVLPLRLRAFKLWKLDAVVTPSYFVRKMLGRNAEVIRLGIDVKRFRPMSVKRGEKLRVGYFGHPSAYKGLLDFARASRKFPKDYESYIYISDTSEKMLRNLRKMNPLAHIAGHVSDIAPEYNKMDIIVLPYRSHLAGVANPLVLLEAMACGRAVVTTDFAYLKEIVKDAAVLVKPYSPKSIVKAVKRLRDEKLRDELGKKARRIIVEEFEQEMMFDRYARLYNARLYRRFE